MIPAVDYIRILPELVLSIFGIIVMMVDPVLPEQGSRKRLGIVAVAGTLAALAATAYQTGFYGEAFYHMVRVDTFSVFFHVVVLMIALVVILASYDYLDVQSIRAGGEYYALILFGTVGMMLMSSAIELVLIFIALEISSISTYILAGMRRRAAESAEASLKYFLLGSFATAFFLYGVAM
ncbi:MAG: proton-conducting transporter membrane subunit, partial [Terriglobales bacterium]